MVWTMKMSNAFPIKLGIYSLVFGYVLLDLFVFEGPLQKMVESKGGKDRAVIIEEMEQKQIAAYVFRHPIYLSQVDYFATESLAMVGIDMKSLKPNEMSLVRRRFLDLLVEQIIVRVKVEANENLLPVDDALVATTFAQLKTRFASDELRAEVLQRLDVQGDVELELRVKALLQQDRYLAEQLEKNIPVDMKNLEAFFHRHKEQFKTPELVRLQHVFISHLDHPDDGEELINNALSEVEAGADFSAVVAKSSEDLNSKARAGDLGWMSQKRMPVELAAFAFPAGNEARVKGPLIIESKLGWHLVQITGEQAAKEQTFEQCEAEIVEAAKARAVQPALIKWRKRIRDEAGIMIRHKDTSKDSVTLKNRRCRVEIFSGIFSLPYTQAER